MMRALLPLLTLLLWLTAAAAPPLAIPALPPGADGTRVPPNVLISLSLTFEDAAAAYRGEYDGATVYEGYFNPALCYSYPMKARTPASREPDLDERRGYFAPAGPADAGRACDGATFSGNFMNWATASRLDLLRYGLTGGDRVIDEAGLTVLQRAWLPDGAFHPDFYANPVYFPRKMVSGDMGRTLTPFAGAALYIVSCRNRVLFSTSRKGADCDAPRFGPGGGRLASDKYHGEFNARVAVCDARDSASRPDLCQPYGQGFKPEGSIQRAAAASRIGLMSYLTEQGADDPAQYGGVLRAPLKALNALDASAPAEWDAATGVLARDPDGAGGMASGALNYINRLGRGNDARRGAYKDKDPGAELYYEALRYLQGRAAGVAGAGPVDDGAAVWTRRADPVTASCQRNVIAAIGHDFFIEDRFVPGNTRTDHQDQARPVDNFAGSAFDVMQSTRRVGEMEADTAGAYGNAARRPDLAGLERRDDGPGGAGSFYIAGAALWANTHAVRPDLPVTVGTSALALGGGAAKGSSALYLAAKYGGFADLNLDGNPFATTGGRHDSSEWSADGVRPHQYHDAADGAAIVEAARALLAGAGMRPGLVAGTMAASPLARGAGYLVQTAYDAAGWHGTVQRRALTVGPGGALSLALEADWDTGVLLGGVGGKAPAIMPSARNIFTLNGGAGSVPATIRFEWATLPAAMRLALDAPGPGMARDGQGEARLAYLRGVRTMEHGQPAGRWRRRVGVLGDIVRSVPLIVGAPSPSVLGEGYAAFHRAQQGRRHMVYVGANDGMLHGFDSASGTELFAYIPHALLPALPQLTSSSYTHRAFVDASAGSGEARVAGRWRTILASGMGMGARGVFALDITDPAGFEQGMGALWEFTAEDDAAMGHVHAPPLIVKLRTAASQGQPVYRYFVMVASGINPASTSGAGALFLLALDKPAATPWQLGLNYFRFTTRAQDGKRPNALGPPALALAGDGSVRRAYAGDLQGNLWRFDFSGDAPWRTAQGQDGEPLYAARDAAGARQPIAQAPRAVFAPGGGYLVLFGTGKLLESADLNAAAYAQQSFYAVHDRPEKTARSTLTRADLALRTLSGVARLAVKAGPPGKGAEESSAGWYVDFPGSIGEGEHLAASPTAAGGAVMFDTVLPGGEPCAVTATRSYVLGAVSGLAIGQDGIARDGEETGERTASSITMPPLILETGAMNGPRNATGTAQAVRSFTVVRTLGAQATPGQQVQVRFQVRRLGWREVANWSELHQAASK